MKKTVTVIAAVMLLLMISIGVCYADDLQENDAQRKHVVDEVILAQLLDGGVPQDEIDFLCAQVDIYGATDEMIANYANGLLEKLNESEVRTTQKGYEYTNDGCAIITEFGLVPNIDPTSKWVRNKNEKETNNSKSMTYVSTVSDWPYGDQSGVIYEIKSIVGHNKMTSFATRPTITNAYVDDRPYLMFGFQSENGDYVVFGDIGLVYFPNSSTWKGFYNIAYRCYDPYDNETLVPVYLFPNNADHSRDEDYSISFTGGSSLYFQLEIVDSPDKAVLTIRDATTWDIVCTIERAIMLNAVPSNYASVRISKQITLAQIHQPNNDVLDITTGTIVSNAQYSQTYLYTPNNSYYSFTPTYCYAASRIGPSVAACQKLSYSPTPWTGETVYISFN